MATERSVLISGAAGGVGRATALRLAESGWRVLAGVRTDNAGEDLLASLGVAADRVCPVVFDLSDGTSIARLRPRVEAMLGPSGLDALVNNAGVVVMGPVELVPEEALRHQFQVNVIGHVLVAQALLPLLRARRGRVVMISGAAASTALPLLGPIAASKAALETITDALRMELAYQGVSVSIVIPGLLKTQLHPKAEAAAERAGWTGDHVQKAVYTSAINRLYDSLRNASEAPVDAAVDAIEKALGDRRPATRYVVGRDARQLRSLRFVPARLRDRLLLWNRGFTPEDFNLSDSALSTGSPAEEIPPPAVDACRRGGDAATLSTRLDHWTSGDRG